MNRILRRGRAPFAGLLAVALVVLPTWTARSADPPAIAPAPRLLDGPSTVPDSYVKKMTWRGVGPANMGGRITAVAVVESDPNTYFVATASGGLIKTVNNGTTFEMLFDKEATVSIGDVAVAPSDPKTVWVGTGENNPRNSVSFGDGVYKSTDAGKTWTNMGLEKSFQIGKIVIHPKDANTVYVGALGRLYGPNEERGLFKTTDGGKSWKKILYVDDKTGVIDFRMDPNNAETLLVGLWQRQRDEFDGFFGPATSWPTQDQYGPATGSGPGGGLFKTTDGGATWKKLTDEKLKNGLPTAKTGRIGLDYSRKTKGLVYAIIDTERVGMGRPVLPVYIGLTTDDEKGGGVKVQLVADDGPAGKGGLKVDDVIVQIDDKKIDNYEAFNAYLATKKAGDAIKVQVKRGGKDVMLEVKLEPRAAPEPKKDGPTPKGNPPVLGVQIAPGEGGVEVEAVAAGGPAEQAGIEKGEIIAAVDGKKVTDQATLRTALGEFKSGDKVKLTVIKDRKSREVEVTLAGRTGGKDPAAGNPMMLLPSFTPQHAMEGLVKVATVPKDGVAEKAGVKVGMEVVGVEGAEVKDWNDFINELRALPRFENPRKAGAQVKITFLDKGKKFDAVLPLVMTEVALPPVGNPQRPFILGGQVGGQQPNVQDQQGPNGYQTGGVYVSKDNGETWTRVNSLNPRPFYFSQIRVDPNDDNLVYVAGDTSLWKSTTGGKKFESTRFREVHPDVHALWIDPRDSRHMLLGCDGGFYATYDRGATWDHMNVLALGQFYHVAVDNRKPYRVFGGLQDNGSWVGPSHVLRSVGPVNDDWGAILGGDGFVCRVDPNDSDLVYAESQNGNITRSNLRTGERGGFGPGTPSQSEPPRKNWNTPFILSNHNASIVYCASQYVSRSVKQGAGMKVISPELTRTQKGSATALCESPRNSDVLWAGTDDGYLWITKDGGQNWTNVYDKLKAAGLPGPFWVSTVEASKAKDGRCYVALDAHRSNDDKPYVYVTEDFGQTWKSIASNLPAFGSTRVLREDTTNPDLLYVGTEFGIFASVNRGATWTKLNNNLPTVAVHEIAQPTTASEIVVATHGRSIWILDVASLRQMTARADGDKVVDPLKEPVALFTPAPAVRWRLRADLQESGYSINLRKFYGTNPDRRAFIDYAITKPVKELSFKVTDVTGKTVVEFRNASKEVGFHRQAWSLNRAGGGPVVVPAGTYRAVLAVDGKEYSQPVVVENDPNADPKALITLESRAMGEDDEEDDED